VNLNNNIFLSGASVAISGLIITFSSLGLFAIIIYVLGLIFPYKEELVKPEEIGTEIAVSAIETGEDENIPAVIATAISYFRTKAQSNLGNDLEAGKSGWWAAKHFASQQGHGIRILRSGK
jgi:Na+-transporting methylmalonyl-CoA/oxaloacetate decarboxylase gamma subunit